MKSRKRERGTGGSSGAMREIEKEAEEGAKTHGVKAPGGKVKVVENESRRESHYS